MSLAVRAAGALAVSLKHSLDGGDPVVRSTALTDNRTTLAAAYLFVAFFVRTYRKNGNAAAAAKKASTKAAKAQ